MGIWMWIEFRAKLLRWGLLSGIIMNVYCVLPLDVECVCHIQKKTRGQWSVPYWILSSPVSSALFAPRMFAARPGQKSPTALHDESSTDKDKDDGINYTTVDWREFMCNTWHLEPTLRSALLHRTTDVWSACRHTHTLNVTESDWVTTLNREKGSFKTSWGENRKENFFWHCKHPWLCGHSRFEQWPRDQTNKSTYTRLSCIIV